MPKLQGIDLVQALLQSLDELDVGKAAEVLHVLIKGQVRKRIAHITIRQVTFKERLLNIV